jgi:hypothetical protein
MPTPEVNMETILIQYRQSPEVNMETVLIQYRQ